MANICENTVSVDTTSSEWAEIEYALENGLLDLEDLGNPETIYGFEFSFQTKWGPTPLMEGDMYELSALYPTALFRYWFLLEDEYKPEVEWFSGGTSVGNKSGAKRRRKYAYQKSLERSLSETARTARGIRHQVEIMDNGHIAVDGKNRFGECNVYAWENIRQISCGNWHTVGLDQEGRLFATGSNVNGQCDVSSGVSGPVKEISCGRYHTALLLPSGEVIVKGRLEQDPDKPSSPGDAPLTYDDFPLIEDLRLDDRMEGWVDMNMRLELMSPGDPLQLKKVGKDQSLQFEVLNSKEELLGRMKTGQDKSLSSLLKHVKATVLTVTPLSQRGGAAKYGQLKIRIDLTESGEKRLSKKKEEAVGDYKQTRIHAWPPVARIKSIFDAVIGITDGGDLYIDGFCPCPAGDLRKLMGLE